MNVRKLFFKVLLWTLVCVTLGGLGSQATTKTTTCKDGSEIPVTSICDGKADCSDGSDEDYVGKGFKCRVGENDRNCVLSQSLVQDDFTYCNDASDVCFDHNHRLLPHNCFQCLNGNQIISLNQVCDGVLDCDDFSDECLCQNIENPICFQIIFATAKDFHSDLSREFNSTCEIGDVKCFANVSEHTNKNMQCVSQSNICDGVKDCLNGDDEKFCAKATSCKNNGKTATSCDGDITCSDFSDECNADCWKNLSHCEQVVGENYQCHNRTDNTSSHHLTDANIVFSQVCDNVVDCPLIGSDEMSCSSSTHFYCLNGNNHFVNQSSRYDGVRNCVDGSDECPFLFQPDIKNAFAQKDEMIRNPLLQMMVWLVVLVSLLGNTLVMVYTGRELWIDRKEQKLGRLAKCNRNFVLNLAIADFLMGFSLLVVAIEGSIMSNKYCTSDREWRSSSLCVVMGMMVQCSSQTSVFLLLLMTSYRLYGTLHPFRVEESRLLGGATAASFVAWFVSISIAVIPQTRFAANYFTDQYWFPLPFYNHDILDRTEIEDLVLKIFTLSRKTVRTPLKNLRWNTMIDYLLKSNLTAMNPSWNGVNVVPIGFYNQVPLCQPFFYPNVGDTAWLYMTAIVLFNFLAFVYIGIAYLVIYKNSSRPCVRKSIRKRSKQWRKDNRKMQKKIFCLVFTDMACWFPIGVILVLKLSGVSIHPIVHALTGTVLLPINSAVNPLVYSNVSKNLLRRLCRKQSPFERESSSFERNSIKGSIGSLLNVKTLINNSPRMDKTSSRKSSDFFSPKGFKKAPKRKRVRFTSESSSRGSFSENESKNGFLQRDSFKTVPEEYSTDSINNERPFNVKLNLTESVV